MPPFRGSTPETQRHATRAAIIEGFTELLAEHPYATVTVGQIARRAGINRSSLYRYFPDKDGVLIAYLREFVRELVGHAASKDGVEDLTSFIADVLDHGRRSAPRAALQALPSLAGLSADRATRALHPLETSLEGYLGKTPDRTQDQHRLLESTLAIAATLNPGDDVRLVASAIVGAARLADGR